MAASSFAGTNIRVELDATTASSPTWERQPYITVRHIPASDEDVIQVMGRGQGTRTHRLLLSDAEWVALSDQLGDTGALILAGADQGTCLLEALGEPIRRIDGMVTVQATFRKTAAG